MVFTISSCMFCTVLFQRTTRKQVNGIVFEYHIGSVTQLDIHKISDQIMKESCIKNTAKVPQQ